MHYISEAALRAALYGKPIMVRAESGFVWTRAAAMSSPETGRVITQVFSPKGKERDVTPAVTGSVIARALNMIERGLQ